jgi:phage virion morphogenesis protein
MIEVTTDTSGVRSALSELQRRMSNLSQPMKEIGAVLENKVLDRRETHTDPSGKAWADWTPGYLASYEYKRPGEGGLRRKVLERTGAMWEGLSASHTANSVRVGFDQPYSAFHEFGTSRMARRGLLFADADSGRLASEDEAAVLNVLEEWLSGYTG